MLGDFPKKENINDYKGDHEGEYESEKHIGISTEEPEYGQRILAKEG